MAQVAEPAVLVGGPQEPVDHEVSPSIVGLSPRQLFWRRFRQDKVAIAGGIVVLFMIFLGVAAPLATVVTGHGPNELFIYETTTEQGFAPEKAGPSAQFWFGVDTTSRDLFVRIMYGARASLTVAFAATGIELFIGVLAGVVAGFYRGKTDTVVSRISDVFLALPVILLALGLVAACGTTKEGCLGGLIKPGMMLVALVIGLFSWPYMMRIVRGQVLSLREKEFVQASRSMGASNKTIMWREVVPNLVAPIIVYATLMIPTNILFEAALSYLGIGIPPNIPSWGGMLSEGGDAYRFAWWYMLFPGLFLLALTLAFNLLGDGLRDALDPRTGPTLDSD